MRDKVSFVSGGVRARDGWYLWPCNLASCRAWASTFSADARTDALAAYSARSQVLRKEVSEAPLLDGADIFLYYVVVGSGKKDEEESRDFRWGCAVFILDGPKVVS